MSMKSTVFTDASVGGRTRQSEKDACDVNLIIAHHRRGGVTAHLQRRVAEYGFVPATTFQDCMNEVRKAQEVFQDLPAVTREFFANDPGRFVEFVSDPKNMAKLQELKLTVDRKKAEPVLGSAGNPMVVTGLAPSAPSGSGSGGNPQ